jgi:hypothetical protein
LESSVRIPVVEGKTKLAGGLLKALTLGLLKTSTFVTVYNID